MWNIELLQKIVLDKMTKKEKQQLSNFLDNEFKKLKKC
jgi:hypothetical protein